MEQGTNWGGAAVPMLPPPVARCLSNADRCVGRGSSGLITSLILCVGVTVAASFINQRTSVFTSPSPVAKRLDAFDTWCLRKIVRIPYTNHTTNDTVRSITGCLPVSEKVKSFRLRVFGHLTRSAPEEDHHTAALRPPPDWRRPVGRPRSTCRAESDR